jgi:hypothetical protein
MAASEAGANREEEVEVAVIIWVVYVRVQSDKRKVGKE